MSSRNPATLMSVQLEDTFDFLFKIVLIGDCGTGKTCVVQRFKNGTFIEKHGNTIGVDFSMKTVIVDGKKVKVIFLFFSTTLASNFIHCFSCKYGTQQVKKDFEQSLKVIIVLQMVLLLFMISQNVHHFYRLQDGWKRFDVIRAVLFYWL